MSFSMIFRVVARSDSCSDVKFRQFTADRLIRRLCPCVAILIVGLIRVLDAELMQFMMSVM